MFNNNNIKNRKPLFRIDMVVLACTVVFVACFTIYMFRGEIKPGSIKPSNHISATDNSQVLTTTNKNSNSSKPESSKENSSQATQGPLKNPVPQSQKLDMAYFNSCAFVGDSLSVGLSAYNILSPDKVIASIGLNISKIGTEKFATSYGKVTALEALKKKNPGNIYIMLGSNGIAWMSNQSMISNYSSFIDEIKKALPKSKIYVLSIPPVTENREKAAENPIKNTAIDAYNSELLKMANSKNVYFVDINTALKNNLGKLDVAKAEKDGMHFKKATYSIMIDYLLSHNAG